jgi:hypothetical protein
VKFFLVIIPQIVTACTILHSVLPPWEIFADFPRVQKGYKVFIYTIGYVGGSARSSVPWNKSISINNPDGVNTTGVSKTTISLPVDVTTETAVKPPNQVGE